MAKISVIIPTYNRKDLLESTLDNVLQQTLRPDEIIVVDDHSLDGTIEHIHLKFGSDVVVVANRGKGPGAARNTGLAIATGDYVKFFDSDDLMTRNMLEDQYKVLQGSEKGFVYSPYFFALKEAGSDWRPKDNVILNYFPFNGSNPLWHYMMVEGLFITIPGMMFKRQFLEQVGYWREDVVAYEDWDYLFRISQLEPVPLHTNACAFLYRLHGEQTTATHFSDSERDFDKGRVLEDLYEKMIRPDQRYSTLEKLFYVNKVYQLKHGRHLRNVLSTESNLYNILLHRLVWTALRVKLKYGRARTKTDWQPCHGPLKSREQVSRYISLLI